MVHQVPPTAAFTHEIVGLAGTVRNTWDDGAAFAYSETRGMRHVFASAQLLGSEHHVLVPFALRETILLGAERGQASWSAGADHALAAWVSHHPWLGAHAMASRLAWRTLAPAPGAPPLDLAWTVQLRPVGGGHGHLVFRAGDYGGRTGVAELLALIEVLRGAIPSTPEAPRPFLVAPAFAAPAARALGLDPTLVGGPGSATFVPPAGSASARDAEKLVGAMSAHHGVGADECSRRINEAGKLLLRGKVAEFIAIHESIVRDTTDPETRWRSMHQVGAGHYMLEDHARAIQHYEAALAAGGDPREIATDIADARRKMA